MLKQTVKRIGNLVFAGAVAAGAIWPLSTDTYALEAPSLSSQSGAGVLQYTNKSATGEDKNKLVLLSAGSTEADIPTLEDYLGKLVCSGCGKRCPLTNLRCRRGQQYVESATVDYDAMVAAASVEVDLEPSAAEANSQTEPAESATATAPAVPPQAEADSAPEASSVAEAAPQTEPDESAVATAPAAPPQAEADSPPEASSVAEANPQTGADVEPAKKTAADGIDTAVGYLPLAGIACGGIYLVADGMRKRKGR